MSNSSTNTQGKRCRHCNAEMVMLISKSERNMGRPYWKCFTTYGATRCSGYEWVTGGNMPTESQIENQLDVKELNAYAEVIRMVKGIKNILILLLVLSFLNLAVQVMKK
ncbi:hypothetical protein ACE6H2_001628 [Prunus campanulata]